MGFVRFAAVAEIPPGTSRSLRFGLKHIAVFNVGGVFHAIEDACAHMKAPLAGGRVRGSQVTCLRHGWVYDLATGRRVDKEGGCVRTFPLKVEGGAIFVDSAPPVAAEGAAAEEAQGEAPPVPRPR